MPREHGEDGAFIETIGLDDVREVFDAVGGPVILSADVADALGCSRETARRKLKELYDRGDLDRRKVSRRVIYWEPEEEGRREPTDAARADAGGDGTDGPADPPADAHGGHTAAEADAFDTARERIEELDLAGSGADYDRRRDAVLKMYQYLRDRPGERVSKSDFADLLAGDDVGYGGGFASLWANWVKGSGDRPNVLDTLPGVELRGDDYVFEVDS